mgnify:CR=1 FL=1
MYIILVYDINLEENEGKRVLRNAFKTCKKYLVHIQNSAMLKLEKELKKYIRKDVDSVIVFKSRSQKWLDKKFLGKIEKDKTDNFL